jgi:hypothetical protein
VVHFEVTGDTELLQRGLEQQVAAPKPSQKPVISTHPTSGIPFFKSLHNKNFVPPTLEQGLALIQQANEEEDLRRAGLLD